MEWMRFHASGDLTIERLPDLGTALAGFGGVHQLVGLPCRKSNAANKKLTHHTHVGT